MALGELIANWHISDFIFIRIIDQLKRRVPGISQVEAKTTEEGRVLLRFQDGSFDDPFLARHVSDGTIEMFAYLVLLYDPHPHPLLWVEEPENQLYPKLLMELAEEFRDYALRGGQVIISPILPTSSTPAGSTRSSGWRKAKDTRSPSVPRRTLRSVPTWQMATRWAISGSKDSSANSIRNESTCFLSRRTFGTGPGETNRPSSAGVPGARSAIHGPA